MLRDGAENLLGAVLHSPEAEVLLPGWSVGDSLAQDNHVGSGEECKYTNGHEASGDFLGYQQHKCGRPERGDDCSWDGHREQAGDAYADDDASHRDCQCCCEKHTILRLSDLAQ